MKFDELMAVWRSQDAAPLHDVNKVLLQQALEKDETAVQKARRLDRLVVYLGSAMIVAGMAIFLGMMISFRDRPDKVVTAWDLATPIAASAAALICVRAVYLNQRAQAMREQSFGESLRERIKRRIAQLDHAVTTGRRTTGLVLVLMGLVCPFALIHLGMRVNDKSFSDASWVSIFAVLWCVWIGTRVLRRSVQQAISRKHHLEELLTELDGQ